MTKVLRAIGMMSGTSMDGIDAALIETDGYTISNLGMHSFLAYDPVFRQQLIEAIALEDPILLKDAETKLTQLHAAAVHKLLSQANLTAGDIDVIGFHGQTVKHEPSLKRTWQIGDGELLASLTHIDVVSSFRANDIALGGQGAPFVPLYHAALLFDVEKPVAVVNIGGVANVTYIGENEDSLLGFDVGPGNALMDDWMRFFTKEMFDKDGAYAALGKENNAILHELLQHPYFETRPPKSLDRNSFCSIHDSLDIYSGKGHDQLLGFEDGLATLLQFTVSGIKHATKFFKEPVKQWVICGGGVMNRTLMAALSVRLDKKIAPMEAFGFNSHMVEAQAFGFLAVRSVYNLPLSLPSTTGVCQPTSGGVKHQKKEA